MGHRNMCVLCIFFVYHLHKKKPVLYSSLINMEVLYAVAFVLFL